MIKIPPNEADMVFLCRGIARRTGKWAYGGIVYDPWGDPYIFTWQESGQKVFTRINPDSIGYFINTIDKNGEPIFSDDIIRVRDFTSRLYLVNACWVVKAPDGTRLPLCDVDQSDIELVGEVHRKPIITS